MGEDARERHLARLREHRNRREPDLTLGFLKKQFEREVARPYKQLGELAGLWQELVPGELARHTRLESLSRGVLRVTVDSSAHLYELDRLLRGGLEQELIRRHGGTGLRRVRLRVAESKGGF